ncbi:MAG: cobyric acid synthase [Kiritimatiellaeota bacterium]|nr:cobyric acid synthase [Kiritimatiellota bacterium]
MRIIDSTIKDSHGGDPAAVARGLGLTTVPAVELDFSVNVNPFGIPLRLEREFLAMPSDELTRYPEPHAESATTRFAESRSLPPGELLLGNGSMELFQLFLLALTPRNACCVAPCYSGYAEACRSAGVDLRVGHNAEAKSDFAVYLSELKVFDGEMLFLASPNNPTGVTIPPRDILAFAEDNPAAFVVLDESFVDFLPDRDEKSLFSTERIPANLAVVKSMTKFHAIPGARLGVMRASEEVVAKVAAAQLPWSVNAVAQRLADAMRGDDDDERFRVAVEIRELRGRFVESLEKILASPLRTERNSSTFHPALKAYSGEANFILCEIRGEAGPRTAESLQRKLLTKGILIRSCANIAGLGERFFRLAVKKERENAILAEALCEAFNAPRGEGGGTTKPGASASFAENGDGMAAKRRYRPIMVLGTTSDAGKSLVAAGLCRYFAKKGVKVAPFKAQNMSLNSYVTLDGLEMGRAQVVQAQAAGIEPTVDMNPVLLKPGGDDGSQVVVNGKPMFDATAKEYYAAKREVRAAAFAAFDRLAEEYELIVLEGAGSPAEINLQDDDFVNTAMAERAGADCVLVADINPGGVFASIYGTVSLIPSRHRRLLKGIVINKFRGDESLLDSGIKDIERLTGIPVLKVLPYFRNLTIEEEDAMSLEGADRGCRPDDPSKIDIAVVRLPRISNFTDFLALENSPGVAVRYVSDPRKLGSPDLIIIPGSKNTIADMRFLRESGFENRLNAARNSRIPVFGICGGYQMLGEKISDPEGVESGDRVIRGLGFLLSETTLTNGKELSRVSGEIRNLPFASAGTRFIGYEIHMGETRPVGENVDDGPPAPILVTSRGGESVSEFRGGVSDDGPVFGCYAHGFFDEESVRTPLLSWLSDRAPGKNICGEASFDPVAERERSFDLLAEHLAEVAEFLLMPL